MEVTFTEKKNLSGHCNLSNCKYLFFIFKSFIFNWQILIVLHQLIFIYLFIYLFIFQGRARTQSPTTTNFAVEFKALGWILGTIFFFKKEKNQLTVKSKAQKL
jgi:hypothetical protein